MSNRDKDNYGKADRAPCSHCLTHRPHLAHTHTDTRCFLLRLERAPQGYISEGTITPKLGYGPMVNSQVSTRRDVKTYQDDQAQFLAQISNLEEQLSARMCKFVTVIWLLVNVFDSKL